MQSENKKQEEISRKRLDGDFSTPCFVGRKNNMNLSNFVMQEKSPKQH